MAYYTSAELLEFGFRSLGENVLISKLASIYGASRISIGSNVRIDDFCVLSAGDGGITIGNYVHVAVYTLLIGAGHIKLEDYSGLSSRVSIYSSNDDYSGRFMTNPMVPKAFTGVLHADVHLGKHSIVGSGSVVLPGIKIGEGASVGSLSLVNKDCEDFTIYFGSPIRRVGERSRDLLELEAKMTLDLGS